MNIIKFLDEFTTESLTSKNSSRREMFGTFGSLSKKAALAAIPFGLATASSKSRAATTMAFQSDTVTPALQLALTLEYLEAEFYLKALNSGVLAGTPKAEGIYMQISKHETAHVEFLKTALAGDSIESPTFDFTVGGMFDPFAENGTDQATAYAQLLALAQAFEDTGVRAYKGQAGNLMGSPAVLTAALQIHSVEARHASEIRRLRDLDGWITANERGMGMPEATQAVYDGEENVMQGGLDVTTLGSGNPFSVTSSTQAYDEPMSGDTAVSIASLFIVS
ncbi:MAG: ferritin-like domain-containing protein [Leeuwenhoekiella sp.]